MTTLRPGEVGKGKPPVDAQFKPGQSGNPKGRPRGRHRSLPYETVLGQIVTVRESGMERQLPADAAFLLHLSNKGIAGDGVAARAALTAIEDARAKRAADPSRQPIMTIRLVGMGSVNTALEELKMAAILGRHRASAKTMLEPWLVEAALARLGGRRLSHEQQEKVVAATRTPHKVAWPEWWAASL